MASTLQGFGLGLRPDHYDHILAEQPPLDWLEAVSENFISTGGKPRRVLRAIRAHYPVALHGVGLSIASLERPQRSYLSGLRDLASDIEPLLISDHLCWTRHAGANSHDLLPLAYTREVLQHVVDRVDEVQEYLGRRLYLENASAYIAFAGADLDEASFLAELCQRTGCGLLLDVNNLYVNAMNLGLDSAAYLATIAPETVAYMHLAGHSVLPQIRVDTHDAPVSAEVWTLYKQAVRRFPQAATLLEWDGTVPPFAELRAELSKAERAHREALREAEKPRPLQRAGAVAQQQAAPAASWPELAQRFWRLATGQQSLVQGDPELGLLAATLPAPAVVGINVYADAYFLRLEAALSGTFPTLQYILGKSGFHDLARAFLREQPSTEASIKYVGQRLPAYLQRSETALDLAVPQQVLADIAAFEWTMSDLFDSVEADPGGLPVEALDGIAPEQWEEVGFRFIEALRFVPLTYAVAPVIDAVSAKEVPARPEAGEALYLLYRQDEMVAYLHLARAEARCFERLRAGDGFGAACLAAAELVAIEPDGEFITAMVGSLGKWFRAGLICEIVV